MEYSDSVAGDFTVGGQMACESVSLQQVGSNPGAADTLWTDTSSRLWHGSTPVLQAPSAGVTDGAIVIFDGTTGGVVKSTTLTESSVITQFTDPANFPGDVNVAGTLDIAEYLLSTKAIYTDEEVTAQQAVVCYSGNIQGELMTGNAWHRIVTITGGTLRQYAIRAHLFHGLYGPGEVEAIVETMTTSRLCRVRYNYLVGDPAASPRIMIRDVDPNSDTLRTISTQTGVGFGPTYGRVFGQSFRSSAAGWLSRIVFKAKRNTAARRWADSKLVVSFREGDGAEGAPLVVLGTVNVSSTSYANYTILNPSITPISASTMYTIVFEGAAGVLFDGSAGSAPNNGSMWDGDSPNIGEINFSVYQYSSSPSPHSYEVYVYNNSPYIGSITIPVGINNGVRDTSIVPVQVVTDPFGLTAPYFDSYIPLTTPRTMPHQRGFIQGCEIESFSDRIYVGESNRESIIVSDDGISSISFFGRRYSSTTVGLNGPQTALAASTWYGVYLIWGEYERTEPFISIVPSGVDVTMYGYAFKRFIGWVRTLSTAAYEIGKTTTTGQQRRFECFGDLTTAASHIIVNNTSHSSLTPVNISTYVPVDATHVYLLVNSLGTLSSGRVLISADSTSSISSIPGSSYVVGESEYEDLFDRFDLPLYQSGTYRVPTVFYQTTNASTSIWVIGYTITL